MTKCTQEELKRAMVANNISTETLRNYIVEKLKEPFSNSYIYHIINGTRESEKIEAVIWDLVGPWVELHRKYADDMIKLPEHLYHNKI